MVIYAGHYGQDNSVQLAKAWARKANWLCQVWADAGSSHDFAYSQEQIDAYTESDEFLDWALAMDVESPAFDRIMELRTSRGDKLG